MAIFFCEVKINENSQNSFKNRTNLTKAKLITEKR